MRHGILKLSLFAVAAIVALGTPGAEAQVTATLALIPEQTLPGLPVDLRLTLSNTSAQLIRVRNGASLEVTTEAGATFLARGGYGDDAFVHLLAGSDVVGIQPGATRDYYWHVPCDLAAEFFMDRRLSKPGRYSLRMQLLPEGVYAPQSVEAVWTNAVTLTVRQPQGDDAAVWAMLLARAAKPGQSPDGFSALDWANQNQFAIAEEIYTKYPGSSYVAYVACFKPAPRDADRLRHLEAALALGPAGPIADRIKLSIATLHAALADHLRAMLDADAAISELALARQILQEVEAQSVYPFLREDARNGIDHLASDDHIRESVAFNTESRRRSPYQQVIPFVDCVSIQHDGGLTARFGYRNIKDQTETIPAGSTNALFPPDAAKKLPTSFRAGVHGNAVRATTVGGPVTWKLLLFTATATKDSKPCGGNN